MQSEQFIKILNQFNNYGESPEIRKENMEDWEYSDYTCPKCGENLRTRDCENCGGEGTIDDLFESDPCWYEEDDWEYCSNCQGVGAFFWCGNENCDVTEKEIKKALKEQNTYEEDF
jgi:DnaJ-class molecular chaperone